MKNHSFREDAKARLEQKHSPLHIRAAAAATVVLMTALMCEGLARVAVAAKETFLKNSALATVGELNDYQMLDPTNRKLWRLRPGYAETLGQAIAMKQRSGRILAATHLIQYGKKLQIQPEDIIFRINSEGFKGPELDRTHSRLRILTLGDSCTFESLFDQYSYPRVLERELRQIGWNVEVVNGAVEGYSPKHVLMRVAEYKGLRPEITTIYIGWNGLFSDDALPERFHLYTLRLVRSSYARLFPERVALAAYTKPKHPDRTDPQLRRVDGYVPPFIADIEQIIRQMQTTGSTVVLVTLPGLYTTEQEPSVRALQVGHLPNFTDNPYVLAKMAEWYNTALREMAKKYGLPLIDLERWSETALQPRDAYFVDSVHLSEEGEVKIGEYIAKELTLTKAVKLPALGRDATNR